MDQLLGRIAGFFEKDFLFASFLPSLLFLISVSITVGSVIGFGATWSTLHSPGLADSVLLLVAFVSTIVVFAYILNALRPALLKFWSGESPLAAFLGATFFGRLWHRRRFKALREKCNLVSHWNDARNWFESEAMKVWSIGNAQPTWRDEQTLRNMIAELDENASPDNWNTALQPFVDAIKKHGGMHLGEQYKRVKLWLLDRHERDALRIKRAAVTWDSQYARSLAAVRATRLGNVIAAYEEYPTTRYGMQAEVFWPRLRSVVHPSYLVLVHEPRILLDFSLTMASLALVYSLLAIVGGPWLWTHHWLWLLLAIIGLVAARVFYSVGIVAAEQLGSMLRSAFDLYRLDLLKALQVARPKTLTSETDQWELVSRLVIYGSDRQPVDFELRPEDAPEQSRVQQADLERGAIPRAQSGAVVPQTADAGKLNPAETSQANGADQGGDGGGNDQPSDAD